jgi:hypothetical protein
MVDERLARLRTHRNNILRYRKLLNTKLLEHERLYVLKRLSEEQSAIEGLESASFSSTAKAPSPPERQIV